MFPLTSVGILSSMYGIMKSVYKNRFFMLSAGTASICESVCLAA